MTFTEVLQVSVGCSLASFTVVKLASDEGIEMLDLDPFKYDCQEKQFEDHCRELYTGLLSAHCTKYRELVMRGASRLDA